MALSILQGFAVDDAGDVLAAAEVKIWKSATGALVQTFTDETGGVTKGNPFDADDHGYFFCYLPAGIYKVQLKLGAVTRVIDKVEVGSGNRYDVPFMATGHFGAAEMLMAFAVVTPLTLPAGLPGSRFICNSVPTASATFTFKKSTDNGATWSAVFTVTFALGQRVGTVTLAAAAELAINDLLAPFAPTSIDATLQGLAATIAASSH